MAKKVTTKNFESVLDNFKSYMVRLRDEKSTSALKLTCKEFNDFLDGLASDDAFGTEGQLDPRGDQRD